MPCFLFTYHGYGTWYPDREVGFVKRKHGVQAPDEDLAKSYRFNANQDSVDFHAQAMQVIIDAAIKACEHQQYRCHYIALESTHVHILLSWKHKRTWELVGRQLRTSLTRALNAQLGKREWFSKSGSRQRVKDETHFYYLINTYLPGHRGLKWSEA